MDIKTLMLGDWVKYQCMPTQVEEIQSDGINGEWDGQECYGNLSASDLYPIKLTQELFEKNGWEFPSKYSTYMLHAEFHKFTLFPEKDGSFTIRGKGDIKCIQYVHELQQALRFFGNYNLANNFKIK